MKVLSKNPKLKGAKSMEPNEPLLLTRKDVLTVLPGRSERYVSDMKRAGLQLPTTRTEVLDFLRRHPSPTRSRNNHRPSRIRARQIRKSCRA